MPGCTRFGVGGDSGACGTLALHSNGRPPSYPGAESAFRKNLQSFETLGEQTFEGGRAFRPPPVRVEGKATTPAGNLRTPKS